MPRPGTFDVIEVVKALAITERHEGNIVGAQALERLLRILAARAEREITSRTLICSFCRRWLESP